MIEQSARVPGKVVITLNSAANRPKVARAIRRMKTWTSASAAPPISPVLSPLRLDNGLEPAAAVQRAWSEQWLSMLAANSSAAAEYGVAPIPTGQGNSPSWGVVGGLSVVVLAKSSKREAAEKLMGRYLAVLEEGGFGAYNCSEDWQTLCPFFQQGSQLLLPSIGINRFSELVDFSVYRRASDLLQRRISTFLVAGSSAGNELELLLDKVAVISTQPTQMYLYLEQAVTAADSLF